MRNDCSSPCKGELRSASWVCDWQAWEVSDPPPPHTNLADTGLATEDLQRRQH